MSTQGRYAVVVPVKPPAVAKSRLAPLGDRARRDLAVAFAVDTVRAALRATRTSRLLVVTDDHVLAGAMTGLGAGVVPDCGADLNATLLQGVAEASRRSPGLPVAALCADLPALQPEELDVALERALGRAAYGGRCFVADADGGGTTLVTADGPEEFRPRFGAASRDAHLDEGTVEIDADDLPGLRRDVDTPAHLAAAVRLGVGERTARLAAGLL